MLYCRDVICQYLDLQGKIGFSNKKKEFLQEDMKYN